jgi:methyl-accepting chemotaxis protein
MPLPPDFAAALRIYGIPDDADGLPRRRKIWKLLAPRLDAFLERHLDDSTEHALVFKEALTERRQAYKDMLLRYYETLFTQPYDEHILVTVENRVKQEIKLGYDLRARTAVGQTILSALHAALRDDPWISKRAAFDLADLANRIVMLDTGAGVTLHYGAKAREGKMKATFLREAVGQFAKSMFDVRAVTTDAVAALGDTAGKLAEFAQSAAARAGAAAEAANDTALNVANMASATEELFASIKSIREQTSTSTRMANDAVTRAGETNATILSLSEAVAKIGSVVDLIAEIAGSTNMLSLNATIEAARAGHAGRGFAVVAAEVKGLASQTSQATREISKQIGAIQAATQSSVSRIGESTQAVEGIASMVDAVATSVDQQAGATGSIAKGVNSAACTTTTLAEALRSIEETVHLTQEASNAALELSQRLAASDKQSRAAMDALFEAAEKHEGISKMSVLSKTTA